MEVQVWELGVVGHAEDNTQGEEKHGHHIEAGPFLGPCGPCDRTGPPNFKGPQNIISILGVVI